MMNEPIEHRRQIKLADDRIHYVIQCACQKPDDEPIVSALEIDAKKLDERRVWTGQDSCFCKGTGWVCHACMGRKWTIVKRRAVPCAACTVPDSPIAETAQWMRNFIAHNQIAASVEVPAIPFADVGELVFAS